MINAHASTTYYIESKLPTIESTLNTKLGGTVGLYQELLFDFDPENDADKYPFVLYEELTEGMNIPNELRLANTFDLWVHTTDRDFDTNRQIRNELMKLIGLTNDTNEMRKFINKGDYDSDPTSPERKGAIEIKPAPGSSWMKVPGYDDSEVRYRREFYVCYRLTTN